MRLEGEPIGPLLPALHGHQLQFAGPALALVVLVAAAVAVGAFEVVLQLFVFLLELGVEFVDPFEFVLVELLEGVVLVAQEVVQREFQVAVHLDVAVDALLQFVVFGFVET
jgi:hypothetical protein